jgi:hypothetical protein
MVGIQEGFILYLLGMVLNEGDKIVSINLSDNNLVGEIPNEIVTLTDLKELNLQKFDIGCNSI